MIRTNASGRTLRSLAPLALVAALLSAAPLAARAALSTDLQALDVQSLALRDHLAATTLGTDASCARLVEANRMARDLVNGVAALDAALAAPLTVDAAVLDALDRLGITALGLANEALRLSTDLDALAAAADGLTVKNGLVAMLQLSDDIGTMADRIGEMADKILTLSDDIGTMADRILATQELQNQNVALTTQSVLATQANALAVVSVIEDASYSFSIATLIAEGEELAARMQAVVLKPWTMATELARVAADVRTFLGQVKGLQGAVAAGAAAGTFTVSPTGLVELTNLSAMLAGLGTAVDGYVVAIGGLEAITTAPTLEDSLRSMLQLSADIGVMANRILEMGDVILAMSDNIGMQADVILATQAATNADIAGVQGSILAAQSFAVTLFAVRML